MDTIVLRTHYYDENVDRMVAQLRVNAGRPIVAAVDERKGPIEIPAAIRKIQIEPKKLGVLDHPDYGWRCGDYSLYAALEALPDVGNFWLIEPDVRIHSDRLNAFFDGSSKSADADFVTAWFTQANSNWVWHQMIARFVPNSFHCMLQLSRLSRRAVTHLFQERRALTERFMREGFEESDWPNDEGFVGAIMGNGQFRVVTVREHAPEFHTAGTFTFTQPTSGRWLESMPKNDAIYHPVAYGKKFFNRVHEYLNSPDRLTTTVNKLPAKPSKSMEEQIIAERLAEATTSTSPVDPKAAIGGHSRRQPSGMQSSGQPSAQPNAMEIGVRSWNRIRNNGDAISAFIVDRVLSVDPFHAKSSQPHLLGVGSILFMANGHSVIWGSGVLNQISYMPPIAPSQVRALRGKLSVSLMREKGIAVSDVPLGDPGIFAKNLLTDQHILNRPTKYRVAVVPHHDSIGHPFFSRLIRRDDVCVIDILSDDLTPIEQIAQADIVVSQSLHGLIYAESLGKPSVWISTRTDEVWNFKFQDWFSTTANPQLSPVSMDVPLDALLQQAELRQSTINKSELIDAFPRELESPKLSARYSYVACRRSSPFYHFVPKMYETTNDFDYGRDKATLDATTSSLQIILNSLFNNWAERPYCIVMVTGTDVVPAPEQSRVIRAAMDARVSIDFAFMIKKESALPLGVTSIDLGHGVVVYPKYKAIGPSLYLRPSFESLNDNFIVFGI